MDGPFAHHLWSGVSFLVCAAVSGCGGDPGGAGGGASTTSTSAGSQAVTGSTNQSGANASSGTITSGTTSSGLTTVSGTSTTTSSGAGGPCPAPAPTGTEVVIYGEGVAPEWACYGFSAQAAPQSVTVCSGSEAMAYSAHQYDGFQFQTDTAPVSANHLSVRVNVDQDSDWTIAAVKPGETDPHQFLGNPTVQSWKAGWQDVELDIPSTTPQTRWILFEHQSTGQVQLVVDDLRLSTL